MLLSRWVPDMESRWRCASANDIAAIEELAGGELPRCYRWMLLRLGEGWQNLGFGSLDFSARGVVEGHARGDYPRHAGMLCIAEDKAEEPPQRRYYDLAHSLRDDAPVYVAGPEESDFGKEYETLREMIASAVFDNYRLRTLPCYCEGVLLSDENEDAFAVLAPHLAELGFRAPVPGGSLSLLYDDGTFAFSSYRYPEGYAPYVLPFHLGGPSLAELRRLIGIFTTSTSLVAEHLDWAHPIQS
ncbi:MAG: hypothetical protein JNK56_35215 [Myxococcales bacterium]|nr:hypothetical protein [Myxococcales bacterium]